jgi:hypothetical protein
VDVAGVSLEDVEGVHQVSPGQLVGVVHLHGLGVLVAGARDLVLLTNPV